MDDVADADVDALGEALGSGAIGVTEEVTLTNGDSLGGADADALGEEMGQQRKTGMLIEMSWNLVQQ